MNRTFCTIYYKMYIMSTIMLHSSDKITTRIAIQKGEKCLLCHH